MVSPSSWLSRYQSGQRKQVWHELRQLGGRVREPEFAQEAQLVCDEMARRARHNIELIVDRLSNDGYRFHANNDDQTPMQAHIPPTPASATYADWLQQRFDTVPMTLMSWIRIVGDVWLVGTHPHWPTSASADPLVIEVERTGYPPESSMRAWLERRTDVPGTSDLFELPLAPDRFHKENTSGGSPYGIVLPDSCADGSFTWDTPMPFVSYLNWVFSNGGFPWPSGDDAQWDVRYRLVKDLLPL
ncbi:hypothetical protein [Kutzneria buriramensis]|uniref:Uncharacterized protein n=1 Tax=Kutzneria buriramensis TaxID=1045776 RepID=A0A3E0GUK4_9PSEU|nr:hypothetical protein [Kutzneria buriramensis]REH25968.1 hypothetical protein BCF44_1357 [Kutzneria buriramensis]